MTPRVASFLTGSIEHTREAMAELDDESRPRMLNALLVVVGDGKASLADRIGAGTALSLLGDPRIHPTQPQMVRVAEGPFQMGMDPAEIPSVAREFDIPEAWLSKACPHRTVELDDFEIGLFPVTNLEWRKFSLATGGFEVPESWPGGSFPEGRENHPVWGICFEAIVAYCDWISHETGRRYRLPTEAEWEKAARGPDGRAYPWGDRFDPRRANTREAGIGETTPVGLFREGASPHGILDLAGNVEECTASIYRLYPDSPVRDPEEGSYRVARGGCFRLDGDLARTDRRHGLGFDGAVGFRLARSRSTASESNGESES